MSKRQFIRPLVIVALLGSLSGNTWAEAKDKMTEAITNAESIAQSESVINQFVADVDALLARQLTGKLIDPTEQWLLAISRRPIPVGAEKLNAEAEGLRKLPPSVIKAWQKSREILTY